MNASIIGVLGLISFFLAYRIYGRFIEKKVFNLDEETQTPPSEKYRDNIDFVPTKKSILIGHHFSSIAGAAPIVGPAIAAIWGWGPALIWIVLGVIFLGACHDYGALVLSMKFKGKSIAAVAGEVMGKRARHLFLIVIFFLVWIVIAVFALVIANLFIKFPSAVIPVNFEIFIAIVMGLLINKKNKSLTIPSILAQLTLLGMIVLGTIYPISLKTYFGENELMIWITFLMIYSFIASTLPVWTLLQPRDYINSHQLFMGLTLMVLGLIVTSPKMVAPAFNLDPIGAPPIFPYLFITVACGAISGFHGLVSSGTTSKQVKSWKDARGVAYGSMLLEGLLALLATLAVTAGIKTPALWHSHYASWSQANGLSAKISAFVHGAGSFVSGLGISESISHTVIAVLIISFAATTLDTATRIQRYIIGEFGKELKIKTLQNRFVGSFIAVFSAFLLMFSSEGGKGGLSLWPLFGATNQMLAGITLVLITTYLLKNKKKYLNYLLPAIFVMSITLVGLIINIINFVNAQKWFLALLGFLLCLCQSWIILESFIAIRKNKG